MRIPGSVALVTGGSSGLGLATARRLVASEASVVLMARSETAGRAVAKELGSRALFVAGDVADESDVTRALDAADRLGPLRIVVSCAGVSHARRLVNRSGVMPLAEFETVVRTNLVGTFNVIRLAVPRIVAHPAAEEDRGVIVNTSSIAAWDGQVGQAAYAAAKSGIVGMTLPLARELSVHGIRVVTIAPGLFDTPVFSAVPATVRDVLGGQVPHPERLGVPDEFASLVEHVVGNGMLNGETIRLDGALRLPPR
ncbi:SDR family NAD(P)-dependent oxidoreductase [Streptomyces sp. NPDC003006]